MTDRKYTVLRLTNDGEIVKTVMVCLTEQEAMGVARAGNKTLLLSNATDFYRVKEEN